MFYYKVGEIETNVRWVRPSKKKLLKVWNEVTELNAYVNEYDCYLVGGFPQGVPTWDIDVILIGDKDYVKIKSIINDFKKIGFKHEQFIDIRWSNLLVQVDQATTVIPEYTVLRNFNQTYKEDNGKSRLSTRDYIEVHPGLFETTVNTFSKTWEKVEDRYNKKMYRGNNHIKLEKYLYL